MSYEAVEAFARGLMSALMQQNAAHQPNANETPTPTVIKTEDVERAVAKYVDYLIAQGPEPQEPVEDDIPMGPTNAVIPPQMEAVVRETMGDLSRIPKERHPDDDTYTYDANMPGEGTWQTPKL